MKLLAISPSPDLPEAKLLIGLKNSGITVFLMGDPSSPRAGLLLEAGIEILPCTLASRINARAIIQIREALTKIQPDIVHAFTARGVSNAVLALTTIKKSARPPLVGYRGVIGNLSIWDPSSWFSFRSSLLSKIVCVSKAVEEYLRAEKITAQKLCTIYKGHEPEWYQSYPRQKREEFSLPSSAVIFCCVANLRAQKGAESLVLAFNQMAADAPHAALCLIGETRKSNIEVLVSQSPFRDRIHLLGFRSDATQLQGICDVTMMTSLHGEGFPKGVIEGMCQGLPAIVTRTGGMKELIEEEVSGLFAEPGDSTSIANAMRRLALNAELRKKMGESARLRIHESFSSVKTVEEHRKLYHSLLNADS